MSGKARNGAAGGGPSGDSARPHVRIIPAEAAGETFARWGKDAGGGRQSRPPEEKPAPPRSASGKAPADKQPSGDRAAEREYAGFRKPKRVEAPRMPTAADIEALQQQAWEEGYRAGEQAGQEAGHAEGLKRGEAAGREAGYQAGYRAGEKEVKKLARRMDQLVRQLDRPLEQMDEEVEQALTELAVHLARQIIYRELRLQPGEIVRVIREAVGLLPVGARNVEVHLHPDDARFLRETLSADGDTEHAWQLVDDPAISRGGCRVSTQTSHIDATLEHRLAQLAQQVLGNGRGQAAGDDDTAREGEQDG